MSAALLTSCSLQMPSAFTPNNDGINDVFKITYPAFVKSFHMVIYDRWGRKIYNSSNPFEGWNGNVNSSPADPGTYIWVVTMTDNDCKAYNAQGTVVLMR